MEKIEKVQEDAAILQSHMIAHALYRYSLDHNGEYPEGETSTEVFQKLLDEKYISPPGIFFIPLPGKTRLIAGQLTSENVCFDVTSGIKADSSPFVPVVYLTGYTVNYTADAGAKADTIAQFPFLQGIAVVYKNNHEVFLKADSEGAVLHFIPADFTSGTSNYRQLKP
jgi:hypothetical protein